MDGNRSEGGRNGTQVPQSEPWRFPDWQGMIDKLHAEGFKFGLCPSPLSPLSSPLPATR